MLYGNFSRPQEMLLLGAWVYRRSGVVLFLSLFGLAIGLNRSTDLHYRTTFRMLRLVTVDFPPPHFYDLPGTNRQVDSPPISKKKKGHTHTNTHDKAGLRGYVQFNKYTQTHTHTTLSPST